MSLLSQIRAEELRLLEKLEDELATGMPRVPNDPDRVARNQKFLEWASRLPVPEGVRR